MLNARNSKETCAECVAHRLLQGKSWRVSDSILHGGELSHNWMIENTIAPVTLPNGKPSLLQVPPPSSCYHPFTVLG